jgi:hypothetical protein
MARARRLGTRRGASPPRRDFINFGLGLNPSPHHFTPQGGAKERGDDDGQAKRGRGLLRLLDRAAITYEGMTPEAWLPLVGLQLQIAAFELHGVVCTGDDTSGSRRRSA